jgi:hypothetical protein
VSFMVDPWLRLVSYRGGPGSIPARFLQICGGQIDIRLGLLYSTSVFPYHYQSTSASYMTSAGQAGEAWGTADKAMLV